MNEKREFQLHFLPIVGFCFSSPRPKLQICLGLYISPSVSLFDKRLIRVCLVSRHRVSGFLFAFAFVLSRITLPLRSGMTGGGGGGEVGLKPQGKEKL